MKKVNKRAFVPRNRFDIIPINDLLLQRGRPKVKKKNAEL